MPVETVSVAQLRRFLVAHQGYAMRARTSRPAEVVRRDRTAVRSPTRLHLDRRPGAQADAHLAARLVQAGHGLATARPGTHLRVLGARGLSAAYRRLPALQATHGAPRECALVGPQAAGPRDREARARRAIRDRGALPFSRLRRQRAAGRDVELEAGEARARASLRRRRAGDRRPRRLPARLRPAGARHPAGDTSMPRLHRKRSSGADTHSARSRAAARSPSGESPSIAAFAVGRRRCVRSSTCWSTRASCGVWPSMTAGRRWSSPPVSRWTEARRRGGVLVSPFDSLLWDKPFVERVFGFQPLIEVYKREPERLYGYYVLPFVLGDRFAGRADLKADRARGRPPREGVPRRARRPPVEASGRCVRSCARAAGSSIGLEQRGAMTVVSPEEARRIAIRAQLLDGSATSVLDTVRRLGSSRSTRSRPSRRRSTSSSGAGSALPTTPPSSTGCSGRRRSCSNGWPSSGRSRICRSSAPGCAGGGRNKYAHERRGTSSCRRMRAYKRSCSPRARAGGADAVARDHAAVPADVGPPWLVGQPQRRPHAQDPRRARHRRGRGRRNGQRLWDLAERWYPETETVPLREGRTDARRAALPRPGRPAHEEGLGSPSRRDRWPGSRSRDAALAVRPPHPRPQSGRGAIGFPLRLEMYVPKAKREHGYYVLPLLVGDRLVGRAEPVFDRKTKTLELLGAWDDTSRLGEAMRELGAWLGADTIS